MCYSLGFDPGQLPLSLTRSHNHSLLCRRPQWRPRGGVWAGQQAQKIALREGYLLLRGSWLSRDGGGPELEETESTQPAFTLLHHQLHAHCYWAHSQTQKWYFKSRGGQGSGVLPWHVEGRGAVAVGAAGS